MYYPPLFMLLVLMSIHGMGAIDKSRVQDRNILLCVTSYFLL